MSLGKSRKAGLVEMPASPERIVSESCPGMGSACEHRMRGLIHVKFFRGTVSQLYLYRGLFDSSL